jgi:hypothetical protein
MGNIVNLVELAINGLVEVPVGSTPLPTKLLCGNGWFREQSKEDAFVHVGIAVLFTFILLPEEGKST